MRGRGFDSGPFHLHVMSPDLCASVTRQCNWYWANSSDVLRLRRQPSGEKYCKTNLQ